MKTVITGLYHWFPDIYTKLYAMNKEDYYINEDGKVVFTEAFHLKRGHCCDNDCKHCPYKDKNK